MIQKIKERFDLKIKEVLKPKPEVMKFVLNHERKDIVLNNLCEQIQACERGIISFDTTKYNQVIDSVATFFSQAALQVKEADLVSYLEKQRRIDEQVKIENLEKIYNEEVKEEDHVDSL